MRERTVCFDGRYVWLAEPLVQRLAVIDWETLKVHQIPLQGHLPAVREMLHFPVKPGTVFISGLSYARTNGKRVPQTDVNWYALVSFFAGGVLESRREIWSIGGYGFLDRFFRPFEGEDVWLCAWVRWS